LAVNPFLDSDAGSRPPTPRANAAHAAPAVPVDSSSGSDSDAPCPPEPLPQPLPWARRGPPLCPVQGPANSWLYVPLLWAAVGDVPADALAAWRAATLTDDWWETSRAQLAASGPVSLARLTAARALQPPDSLLLPRRTFHGPSGTWPGRTGTSRPPTRKFASNSTAGSQIASALPQCRSRPERCRRRVAVLDVAEIHHSLPIPPPLLASRSRPRTTRRTKRRWTYLLWLSPV